MEETGRCSATGLRYAGLWPGPALTPGLSSPTSSGLEAPYRPGSGPRLCLPDA